MPTNHSLRTISVRYKSTIISEPAVVFPETLPFELSINLIYSAFLKDLQDLELRRKTIRGASAGILTKFSFRVYRTCIQVTIYY